jgi:hypothetical protein
MKHAVCRSILGFAIAATLFSGPSNAFAAPPAATAGAGERLQYHPIRVDAGGKIVPWYSSDFGKAFDHSIRLVWKFWDTMAADRNGLPYHMNHQVWRPGLDDHRGIGGDQIQMALSSWALLHGYLGNQSTDIRSTGDVTRYGAIVENMRFMADYYLTHGLSRSTDKWPNIPYPYNNFVYSGIYDGDMILGKNFTQPDKAGSLGIELVTLFKITGFTDYLDAAIAIADTLAAKIKPGDNDNSPMPFKVNAVTGEVGTILGANKGSAQKSSYTSNWVGTLRLFEALLDLGKNGVQNIDGHQGHEAARFNKKNLAAYQKGHDLILNWCKQFPLKTNKWGPFFEDINGWSDTQINAVTFAEYMMDHPALFPEWKTQVRGILDWAERELGNPDWKKYGVIAINEQTAYRVPGNSHSSRQAAAELHYAELTGDSSRKDGAVRQLAWATYMVDVDGKNRYLRDDVWMTDGYGDFVRHYLHAMASAPELAPAGQNHLLRSTSVVALCRYSPDKIVYRTYDKNATETLRVSKKPNGITVGRDADGVLNEVPTLATLATGPGYHFLEMASGGGLLTIRHDGKNSVTVNF